jgi:hypothetical protein
MYSLSCITTSMVPPAGRGNQGELVAVEHPQYPSLNKGKGVTAGIRSTKGCMVTQIRPQQVEDQMYCYQTCQTCPPFCKSCSSF